MKIRGGKDVAATSESLEGTPSIITPRAGNTTGEPCTRVSLCNGPVLVWRIMSSPYESFSTALSDFSVNSLVARVGV